VTRTRTNRTPATGKARAVSKPHDPAEVQADKAADVVARGGSVSGWSFGSVPVAADVHREDKGSGGDDPKKEAAKKTLEALAETKVAKDLQEKVKETPLVKQATDFVGTTPGKIVAGGALAAGVGGLAAAKQPLPIQAPAVPIPKVPGLSAQVKVEGPVNAPTFVGLSLTYKEQGPKAKGAKDNSTIEERAAAFRAQRGALTESFKSQAQKDQDKTDEQAQLARLLASQQKLFGQSTLLPLKPGDKPKTVDVPKAEPSEQPKEREEAPVQREPASTAVAPVADTSGVDGAVRGGGRPLDAATRRSMEARFGYDFSSVRIHDDAAASSAADDVSATAFTVGEDIVLGGGYDPTTPRGRHLIAHELAHVVQQRGAGQSEGEHLHRRSIFESIGILLGLEEGNWTDQELRAYLDTLTSSGHIDGSYDADNKARAIVRKWKQAAPGWDLLGPQKALLIDEMIDGPTLGDDEECILDLLELSDAGDLRTIFADSVKRTLSLEDNLQGDNRIRLNAFEASRFQGGRTELLAGRVTVLGEPVPAGAPSYGFAAATFDARLDSDRTPVELIALIDRFSPDDRKKALDHLMQEVWPKARDDVGKAMIEISSAPTDDAKKVIAESAGPAAERVRKSERILQHFFLAQVPASAADLEKVTKAVDPTRREELRKVLQPKQYAAQLEAEKKAEEEAKKPKSDKDKDKAAKPATVDPPKFHDPDKYRAEVETALPDVVNSYYTTNVTNAGKRGGRDEIEAMAKVAKDETDAVYDQFYDKSKHPKLEFERKGKSGKLHFWYEQAEVYRKTFGDLELAKMWLRYYFQSDDTLRLINDKYASVPEFDAANNGRNPEAKLIVKIVEKATADKETVRKLVETYRNWGGMAGDGNIYVDLFHNADVDTDRAKCWEMFQTLIHEYLHTLVHKGYEDYAKTFGPSSNEWNTLIEGVDCVLDEVVWARVAPKVKEPGLRTVVEGATNAKLPPIDVDPPGRYASYTEAFRLVGLVGIQNVYAAYFLGKVDRISATKEAADKAAKAKAKGGKP
jgi:hypothetical protein